MHQVDESNNKEGPQAFSLAFPRHSTCAQILYIFYFPVFLILSLFPNPSKLEQKNRLVMLSVLNLGCLGTLVYFILDWMHIIAQVLNLKNETLGLTLGNFIFSLAFFNYNLKLASEEQDIEFMQSFLQLGVFKMGVGLGVSYLVTSIYDDDINRFMF